MGNRLYIYDAHSGKLRVSEGAFLTVGAAETNTYHVKMKVRTGGTFACKNDVCRFFPHGSLEDYSINGIHPGRDIAIQPEEIQLMVVAGGCFLCWYGAVENVPGFNALNSKFWYTYDMAAKAWSMPLRLSELCSMEGNMAPDTLVTFEGLNGHAFLAKDIMEAAHYALELEKEAAVVCAEAPESARDTNPNRLTCPHCWEHFQKEDMLYIAENLALTGDTLLGSNALRRFRPTRYDAEGIPLDDEGTPCRKTACPHCHSKLPPFLANTRQHLVSTIGAPYSGKTYLLTTMLNEAFKELPRDFGISIRDLDPKLNAPFNQLRQQFFTAADPIQAYLKNTELGDNTTHPVWKRNKMHTLPAPVAFSVSRQSAKPCYMVFYDTPGTSYMLGQDDMEATMAAGHVNAASAYMFVFDPTLSRSFRKLIPESDDPQMQLELAATNNQTQMLAELEAQLRAELNQPPPHKLHVPLAIVLAKSDVWLHLLGPEPLLPIIRHGRLQPACVKSNSTRLRNLLFSIAPQVCASAEALSDNVCYIAVSALGKAPITFEGDENGGTYIGPENGSVNPAHITDPLFWMLDTLQPGILPRNN